MTEKVVTRSETGGDLNVPLEAVGDQLVRGPLAVLKPLLGNFGPDGTAVPFEGTAIALAFGNVVHDWPVVTLPGATSVGTEDERI